MGCLTISCVSPILQDTGRVIFHDKCMIIHIAKPISNNENIIYVLYSHVTVFQITAFQNTQFTVECNHYYVYLIMFLIFFCFNMKKVLPPALHLARAREHPPAPPSKMK